MSLSKGARINLIAALILACAAAIALGQEFRGSITGRVVDNNGAAVANAAITITNTATNTSSSTTTNGDGDYTALYLAPGSYNVTVEAAGFKKSTRQNVVIRVGDKLQLDLQLEVGNVADTVNVTADAPLLETNTASAGQVVDQRRIQELPLSDGNPFVLSRLAAGVSYTGDLLFSRPFDNGGTSSIVADGATGGNEFTLDGTPNMANGRRVAFVPPAEVVQEFKVQTASFDAQQGHTAGAVVNVSLKSGTNSLHGTGYEFLRNDKLSANDFFLNRQGKPRAPLRYNRYGGAIGGPVWLPKKLFGPAGYDGRNRTFWFFGYEGIRDNFPEPGFATVPTAVERGGNFSALLGNVLTTNISADGNCAGPKGSTVTLTNRDGSPALSGQIYDPRTALTVSRCNPLTGRVESRVERLPFASNIIPSDRLNPVAKAILNYYPAPNTTPSRRALTTTSRTSSTYSYVTIAISGANSAATSLRTRAAYRRPGIISSALTMVGRSTTSIP
ncbi:MAG TPA: carboxypeptidase-like regulatory domain-containing protein [Blastocatellia bacterium]|nr:carboxypeptidase-like regulatory domain-containing protein [Blastocatellia bacterium]